MDNYEKYTLFAQRSTYECLAFAFRKRRYYTYRVVEKRRGRASGATPAEIRFPVIRVGKQLQANTCHTKHSRVFRGNLERRQVEMLQWGYGSYSSRYYLPTFFL